MEIYFASKIENFNNIFSLQFLLPVENYKRIYNYKESRFDINNEYITFYNNIPKIKEDEFIIKFEIKDKKNFIQVNESVSIYPKNFSIADGIIIFLNDKIKKIISARTMITSEVKNMKNFIKNAYVLDENYSFVYSENKYKPNDFDKNKLIEEEYLNINLYDRILGAIYYSLFKNKSSIISNNKIREEYFKIILLEKYVKNLKENKFYIGNIKKGFEKEKLIRKKNIKKELKISGNSFLKIDKNNKYYIVSNNIFKCSNNELIIFNIITNNLCKNTNIKFAMIKIGEDIKNKISEESYLNNYRKLYDIVINGKDKYNIEDINSSILRAFLISLIKYDKVIEIKELSKRYNLSESIYPYFFAGMIQKYSNISKTIINEVEKDIISKLIIDNEIINIKEIMEYKLKRILYTKIQKFQSESNMYRLRILNMKNEFENIEIKSLTRKIINVYLKINNEIYILSFNENKNKNFNKQLKSIGIIAKKNNRYKSFKIKKDDNSKVNDIDEKNILDFINKKFNWVR
ncbi:hypothetical protein UT300005_32810 [Clostridium sp. CTA-5]